MGAEIPGTSLDLVLHRRTRPFTLEETADLVGHRTIPAIETVYRHQHDLEPARQDPDEVTPRLPVWAPGTVQDFENYESYWI